MKEFFAIRAAKGEELMAMPRDAMMDAFDSSAKAVNDALADITADDLGKLGFHPRGLTRLDAWIGLRLVELVAHDWDIRYGEDAEACVSGDGVEGAMTFLPESQSRLFGVRENPPFDGRFLFRSKTPDREWTITVTGEKAENTADASGAHDAVITADGEAHLLLLYGRAKRSAMEAAGRLRSRETRSWRMNSCAFFYTNIDSKGASPSPITEVDGYVITPAAARSASAPCGPQTRRKRRGRRWENRSLNARSPSSQQPAYS